MTTDTQTSLVDTILHEHARLEQEIQDLMAWWSEVRELGIPHFNEMGTRLASLRESLADHMRREEASPLLNARYPASADCEQARARIREDHPAILHDFDVLADRLRACESDYVCWSDTMKDFEATLDQLRRHEEEEVRLARALSQQR